MKSKEHNEEWEWYMTRLLDPSLLNDSIEIFGMLAVPVGGSRKSGSLEIQFSYDNGLCLKLMKELKNNKKFPCVRLEHRKYYTICWGDPIPLELSSKSKGLWYGYKPSICN
jgi:hypothetical protein